MTLRNKQATRFIIDDDLLAWVKLRSAKRRVSASQVIRELVLAEIEREVADERLRVRHP